MGRRKKKKKANEPFARRITPVPAHVSIRPDLRPIKRWASRLALAMLIAACVWLSAAYSPLPWIAQLRTLYIETAMGTMTHQWLATALLPQSVVDGVVAARDLQEEKQAGLRTDWDLVPGAMDFTEIRQATWSRLRDERREAFFGAFPYLDRASFETWADGRDNDWAGGLYADFLDDPASSPLVTVRGDRILVFDDAQGLSICQINGPGWTGKLAIIQDPTQVEIALAGSYGSYGALAADIAKASGALLVVNASGFDDPEGRGNGGTVHGLVIKDGEKKHGSAGGNYKAVGFDRENRLHVGAYDPDLELRDAVEFKPALVIDGETVVSGSAGWGVQPRTAIGQTASGAVLLLVVDGRSPGYSIGCTVGDCAEVLAAYGAVQACNMDGGSSSVMVYDGRVVTRPSAQDHENGRYLPDAWIVTRKEAEG